MTGDEPQGTMGRVQTAGEAPARSCVVFLAKKSLSCHSTISSVKMSSDDSTTLEDLEESFDYLTVSGKSYFSIAFVVYYRIWITNNADSQSFKIMFSLSFKANPTNNSQVLPRKIGVYQQDM